MFLFVFSDNIRNLAISRKLKSISDLVGSSETKRATPSAEFVNLGGDEDIVQYMAPLEAV